MLESFLCFVRRFRLAARLHAARPNPEPAGNDQCREGRIAYAKDPRRCPIIQNPFNPVRDESAGIGLVTGTQSQRHFHRCKRTDNTEPGLQDHHRYRRKMHDSEPRVPDPGPRPELTDKYKNETKHDESDKQHVQQQYRVGSQKKEC